MQISKIEFSTHNNSHFIVQTFRHQLSYSGVTRGGRVAHPWKVWGKFLKEGERRIKGREREKDEEREMRGKDKGENGEEKKGNLKGEKETLK